MKALVFLLVLANLLFYAFSAGYFGRPDNPDAGRVEAQILPERMRIVSRGEAPATSTPVKPEPVVTESKPAEEPAPAPTSSADKPAVTEQEAKVEKVDKIEKAPVCLSWRPLPAADADRLSTLLAKRFVDYKVTRKQVASEGNGWWVFIPPLPGKADAERKSTELRELGVTEFFVVQDVQNRFAISLGVFSSEKGGQDRLAELKAKGVRSAQVAPRPGKDSLVTVQARGPADEKAALLGAVGLALPKSEALICK
ncbi:MAG: hypothetical protein HGA71_02840 [Azonexaceae bacterium]|nr:hypothetical protein [Azonexaceae bacterium]